MRLDRKKDLWETWNDYGSRAYLLRRDEQNDSFVTMYFQFSYMKKMGSYRHMRHTYPMWSPTNRWFVESRFASNCFAKCFRTLREAWNAARKLLIAARKGDRTYY